MSPRLQRLATDWKTYAGLIAGAIAGLAAATELVNKLALAIAGVKHLPPEAKWLAAGLLATLSVLALWASRSRRSILLRPERFVISANDPEHLVGRDEEVKELAKACEQNALVFLQGESGAGKSALALGGLLPHYQATRAGTEAPRLLPIRIDAVWRSLPIGPLQRGHEFGTCRMIHAQPVDLWTSPADRPEPFGPCGQPMDNIRVAHRLPTLSGLSSTSSTSSTTKLQKE